MNINTNIGENQSIKILPENQQSTISPTSFDSVLAVKYLKKSYGKRVIVKNVSLQMNAGQVIGLLGPNGAGKTTSFYMIVGLVAPDAGEVWIDGKNITALPMHRRSQAGLAYLPQETSIFRGLSVEENILAVLELQGMPKKQRKIELARLLNELNINHIAKSSAMSLSGGERRRVEIARTLASNPKFVLLDEPFAGVDPIAVSDIQQIILFLKNKGVGVLITDHNVRETLNICDQAYIISQGEVLANGIPEEIISNPIVRSTYLGEDFIYTKPKPKSDNPLQN
jgi:lipopolysaccharide export system ATP-binding protein